MFPTTIPTTGTAAETLLNNAAAAAGITPYGLSQLDVLCAVAGNLLLDAPAGLRTGQMKAAQFTLTDTASAQTAAANVLTGAAITVAEYTAVNGALTTRTAAQMIADAGLTTGSSYFLVIVNLGTSGTVTLTAGTNVTLTGTMTIANNTWRGFVVTVPTATTMTMQSVMIGTIG